MSDVLVPCAALEPTLALFVDRLGFRHVAREPLLERGPLRVQLELDRGAPLECPTPGSERLDVLLDAATLRIELIHSCAYASPGGFWYDQHEHEWVQLVRGHASLRFADEPAARELGAGDCARIDAHRRHRVEATDPAPGTLWLAVFWS